MLKHVSYKTVIIKISKILNCLSQWFLESLVSKVTKVFLPFIIMISFWFTLKICVAFRRSD
mgnify:CR=1 FL=1